MLDKMTDKVIDLAKARRKDPRYQRPPFQKADVILSSLEGSKPTKGDRIIISEEISRMVDELESELKGNGQALKERIQTHLRNAACGLPSEIYQSGASYENESKGVSISVGDGEANVPAGKEKIAAIVVECAKDAAADVVFLKKAAAAILSGKDLGKEELSELRSILSGNGYWRFIRTL